jgi:ribosomal-protein-alanine N-acetyltransferase
VGDGPRLLTERLVMRRWRDSDLEPFAGLNADPEVMEHFPATLSRAESDAFVARIEARFERDGYGLWALEVAETGRFIGYTGLAPHTFPAHFTPAVEVGWRLPRLAWGHGFATEAARAALAFGFERARLEEIVSFTATTNVRSQAVMRRLGMTHDAADDFDHPALPEGHPLRRHVLYRLRAGAPQARPGRSSSTSSSACWGTTSMMQGRPLSAAWAR